MNIYRQGRTTRLYPYGYFMLIMSNTGQRSTLDTTSRQMFQHISWIFLQKIIGNFSLFLNKKWNLWVNTLSILDANFNSILFYGLDTCLKKEWYEFRKCLVIVIDEERLKLKLYSTEIIRLMQHGKGCLNMISACWSTSEPVFKK
jgi:hypothetical protein